VISLNVKVKGLIALIIVSILWGSSFPVIKFVVTNISEFSYTWIRSLIATITLTPYIIYVYASRRLYAKTLKGGLLAGIAYALGLWLQGWGTRYTTASNSAFITGLNVVFVHLYEGLIRKKYSISLGMSLFLSIIGLYMLTAPSTGFNIGDMLVLIGAVMWAAQVIIVSKYSFGDPLVFTFFEMIPALGFIIPDFISGGIDIVEPEIILSITYLAIVCSNIAFALQVFGQRYVSPAIAAIIFLSEPVFASIFAYICLGEVMGIQQAFGALLIILAMSIASTRSTQK